jgi:Fe-S oxidoreductase
MPNLESTLVAHIRDNSARLADACTACGECYRACPMVPRTPALATAAPEAVMGSIRDILRDDAGTADAIAFAGACVRSGECTPACPEKLDAAFLMRLASLRVRGTLGDPPRVKTPHDPRWSARVKAFARLTMSEEERTEWL